MLVGQLTASVAALALTTATGAALAPKLEQLPSHIAVFCPFTGRLDDGSERRAIDEAFNKINDFIAVHHLTRERRARRTVFIKKFDEETATTSGEAAINIVAGPERAGPEGGIRTGETPSGRVVRFETHAPYGELNSEYEDIVAWIKDHHLKPRTEAWEVYVRQGENVPPKGRLTYIYYAIQ